MQRSGRDRALTGALFNEAEQLHSPKIKTKTLDWNVMGGAFLGRAPAFVVNLGGGDVAVTEQFLHFPNVDGGIEEQSSGGRPQGMRVLGSNGTENTVKDSGGVLCRLGRVAEAALCGNVPRRDTTRPEVGESALGALESRTPEPEKTGWLSSSSVEGKLVQQITEISRDVTA